VRHIDQHSPRASIFTDSLLLPVKFLRLFYARKTTLNVSLRAATWKASRRASGQQRARRFGQRKPPLWKRVSQFFARPIRSRAPGRHWKCLVSRPTNSRPKTRRESAPCDVANPRQVSNLAAVRALPDADFAGFPTVHGLLSMVFQQTTSIARVCPQINGSRH